MAFSFTGVESELAIRWTTAPIPSQVAAAALCVALAYGFRALYRKLRKQPGSVVPVGAITLVVLLTLVFSLLEVRDLERELVRLLALVAAAWAAGALSLGALGKTPLAWSVTGAAALLAALEGLHGLEPVAAMLDAQAVDLGGVRISMWFVIRAVLIVGGLFWLAQRIGDMVERGAPGGQIWSRSGNVLFAKLARAALLAGALLLSLAFLGVDITALAVLSGAVGLGLGFGLQKIVSNYVSGLILLIDKSIKPGDVIEIELGGGRVRGEVTELAGRFTAITQRTGTETLIPNEMLISNPVTNWSHTTRNVQLRLPVGVAYSTDVEKAQALCIEAAKVVPRVLRTIEPACFIVGFGDSSVDLEIRFWIADAESGVRNVSSAVYLEIWKRFQANDIEIPFPQRDLHIRSSAPLSVVVAQGAKDLDE